MTHSIASHGKCRRKGRHPAHTVRLGGQYTLECPGRTVSVGTNYGVQEPVKIKHPMDDDPFAGCDEGALPDSIWD